VSYTEEKMGKVLQALKEFEEAKNHFTSAVAIFEKSFGKKDPRTIDCKKCLQEVLQET